MEEEREEGGDDLQRRGCVSEAPAADSSGLTRRPERSGAAGTEAAA